MKKGKPFLLITLIILLGLTGCLEVPGDITPEYWTWELSKGIQHVTFTSEMLHCSGDSPAEVFSSIPRSIDLVVFQTQDGEDKRYIPHSPWNALKKILPDIVCLVYVDEVCTLEIEKC